MTEDASFKDGAEKPLRLRAMDADDLTVLSGLAQDSVFPANEMTWDRRSRRFAILLNRFRWEHATVAERSGNTFERVQAVLAVEDAMGVATQGIDRRDADTILSLLSIAFEPGNDGGGRLLLTLAGDGAIAVDVEALEVSLTDVTRPYIAPSGMAPNHP